MITKWASVTVSSALAAPRDRKRSFLTSTILCMDSALDQPAPIVIRKPHLILETLILWLKVCAPDFNALTATSKPKIILKYAKWSYHQSVKEWAVKIAINGRLKTSEETIKWCIANVEAKGASTVIRRRQLTSSYLTRSLQTNLALISVNIAIKQLDGTIKKRITPNYKIILMQQLKMLIWENRRRAESFCKPSRLGRSEGVHRSRSINKGLRGRGTRQTLMFIGRS